MRLLQETTVSNLLVAAILLMATPGVCRSQELPVSEAQQQQKIAELIAETEKTLAHYPSRDFTPNLMFQLIELYVRRSQLDYQHEMLLFEQVQKQTEVKAGDEKTEEPQIDYHDAIAMGKQLLAKFPEVLFRDKVLYRIAVCYQEQGDKKQAIEYFKLLSADTEDKNFLDEAYFRLGEDYFEQKNYSEAVSYYRKLLDSWDSPFFDMSLYKLAWCYYNMDDFSEAISTLIILIEDMTLVQENVSAAEKPHHTDLLREAVKYVAISFAEFGGTDAVKSFLADKKEQPFTRQILEQLVSVYEERSFYLKSVATLNLLREFYPANWRSAQYLQRIVHDFELAEQNTRADSVRWLYVEQYGPDSPRVAAFTDSTRKKEILQVAEQYLYSLAIEAHDKARKSKAASDYVEAISIYESYLQKFPRDEHSSKAMFYLAECYFDLKQYDQAANRYYDLMLHYPDSPLREQAAYHRILAYDALLKVNAAVDSVDYFLMDFPGVAADQVKIVKTVNANQAQVLQASNDFITVYPQSAKYAEVALNYATMLYDLNYFDLARRLYSLVASRDSTGVYASPAYVQMATCELKLGHLDSVEVWTQRLMQQFPDSVQVIAKAKTLMASARFKRADNYLTKGDTASAAEVLERLAESGLDSVIAQRALFQAAVYNRKLGNTAKAAALFSNFANLYKHAAEAAEALYQAGLLNEEQQKWSTAAESYLRVYQRFPASPLAERALFDAARCYENAPDAALARKYYQEYIVVYPDVPARYLEACFRRADLAYQAGQTKTALQEFRFVTSVYDKFIASGKEDVDSYFAANAQFMLGELQHAQFTAVSLRPPLKRSLKRKRAAFEQTLKAYTAAAKYKIAEWTTASSFKIGQTFEEFAAAILNAPPPANLRGEALQKYKASLVQSVQPFREKALQTYQANVKQAEEYSVENYWIDESRKRLQALRKELGDDSPPAIGDKSTL